MYLFSRFFGIGMDCLSSMILLTPAVLVILKLSGRKILGVHTLCLLLYVCVLTGIYSVTGIPNIRYSNFDLTLNLIPMTDILSSPEQYLMNILMFLPVGFLLPLLWDQYRDFKQVFIFSCFLTLFIEITQIFTFRTTDIDDLITNLIGAGLGYLLVSLPAKKWNLCLPLGIRSDYEEGHGQLAYLLAVLLEQFFIQPYWSAFFWDTLL